MNRSLFKSYYWIRHRAAFVIAVTVFAVLPFHASAQETAPDPVAIFNEAQDLHEKGDLAGAILLYDKALKIEPAFPEAAYQRGVAQQALGQDDEAENSFRHAVEVRPDWTLAMTSLGSLLVQKGETAEAEKLLTKVLEAEPQSPPALAAMADLRLRTNASADILKELLVRMITLTMKANPTASVWSARAALEARLGNRAGAKQSIESALAIDPTNKAALYQTADMALADGDIERAKDAVRALEAVSPKAEPLAILKANILAAEGKNDEALRLLDSMPGSQAAGEARKRIAHGTASVEDLEKQLESNEKDAAVLGRLCTLLRRDDPAKAINFCRRASEAEPTNINHAIGFAAALVQAKQYGSAVGVLRKLIEAAPGNWTAHANLATALFQSKRWAEARPEYEWLASKQPNLPATYFFLAITFDELGEYADAMANYQYYLKIADPVRNKLDIERVTLRLPPLQRLLNEGKGKKRNGS